MQTVERSALVPYTAGQMFALVNDVARYPEFLPWCVGARVEPAAAAGELLATLKIARGMLRAEFKTRNSIVPERRILMQLVEGPFRHLQGEWLFEPAASGSRVRLRVEFEFKNRWMAAALNPVFDAVCRTTVDAFVLRAQRTFG